MRIGILGGSFDPPHNGHIEMAKLCEEFLGLDKVLFCPAKDQWQKDHESPVDVRAHMVNLAIENHPNWLVSYVDLDRNGKTYSIDTIRDLKKIYPDAELIFIVGSDAANGLGSWRESEALKSEITFAVVERFGIEPVIPDGFKFTLVPGEVQNVSSTEIRNLVKMVGSSEQRLAELLPPDVAKYIAQVGLYK